MDRISEFTFDGANYIKHVAENAQNVRKNNILKYNVLYLSTPFYPFLMPMKVLFFFFTWFDLGWEAYKAQGTFDNYTSRYFCSKILKGSVWQSDACGSRFLTFGSQVKFHLTILCY